MSAVSSQWRMPSMTAGPKRIVCLTEETTEWLYLLGQESRIVGISGYTVRPRRAREEKPKVSAFTSAKIDKIMELEPDCVIGFSDMQADVASALLFCSRLRPWWAAKPRVTDGCSRCAPH